MITVLGPAMGPSTCNGPQMVITTVSVPKW
jgi:hypothetical protein